MWSRLDRPALAPKIAIFLGTELTSADPYELQYLSAKVEALDSVLPLAVFMSSLYLFIVNLAFPYLGPGFRDVLGHLPRLVVLGADLVESI
jgi:hypothetical protein